MLSYHVNVRTKLGSVRSKVVNAESEEAAIAHAKEIFPLYDQVWIEGEPTEAPEEAQETESKAQDRIGEMQRAAEIEMCKGKRREGLVWFAVGLALTLATFLFARDALLLSLAPVLWGGFIYKKNDSRIKKLDEARIAGIPYTPSRAIRLNPRSKH